MLLSLIQRKRTKARQQALMLIRDRRIAALVGISSATFPQLVNVVRWELEALAADAAAEELAAAQQVANNHARRIAYELLHETEDAIAAAKPKNLSWASEDAFQRASSNVVRFVARETGSVVQWFTEKDNRVCEVCSPRDGVVYQVDDAPDCPAHARCRCAIVPVSMQLAA